MSGFLTGLKKLWLKFWWVLIVIWAFVVAGLFMFTMFGNPVKEKEVGKRLEADLEKQYVKEFELEYTRYDANRGEYGAIFHTKEKDPKDNVSFYAAYQFNDELYDTYREEIWTRDIKKAVTKEAKEIYGNNLFEIEVTSAPELLGRDLDRNNIPRYTELSEKSLKNVEIMVNVLSGAKDSVRGDLVKLATRLKDGVLPYGRVIVMLADEEKNPSGFGSGVSLNLTKLSKDFTMDEFDQLLEWDEAFTGSRK